MGTLTYVQPQVTFAISPRSRTFLARKILLADDSVTAQNMGRKILADAGYEVIAVNNGSAALKKIAELKPDLVILDVYMPGYSGLEVCQRLKESQETSRIPVLLSVGKLEPFKPEEAHRVRADAFIVKPFEASELLSALSKLEDKVVPRAEPSKPGRFARAIAAQEEASRGGAKEPSGNDNGWKSRIGFPHEKTAEEKVADEPSVYNQMNRDLRTVVDKSPEQAAPLAEFPEATQDAVAPIPPNLLNDVTPEEVAAIAAAVAQMQMATAAQDFSQLVPAVSEERSEERSEAKPETQNENKVDISTEAVAAAAPVPAATESEVLATMAASAEPEVAAKDDSPRWKAVSVALDSEEASISLENEMRQAYAAFVAEPEQASAVAVSHEPVASPAPAAPEPVPSATYSSSSAEPVTESPVALLAPPEPEPSSTFVSDEPATAAAAQSFVEDHIALTAVAGPERLRELANVSNEPVAAVSEPAPQESSPVESHASEIELAQVEANHEPALHQEFAQAAEEPAPAAAQAEAIAEAAPVSQLHEAQPAPEVEPVIAQAAAVGSYAPSGYAQILHREEHEVDPKPESEVVKSTAAAWASWRQTRDNGEAKAEPVAESNPGPSAAPEPLPQDSAAMAVAAGAEHVTQEISAEPTTEPPAENTEELANIVDSVLADFRPKLMAEISRKMSQKK
jgi:CheY-like chemotaxis protein